MLYIMLFIAATLLVISWNIQSCAIALRERNRILRERNTIEREKVVDK